MRVALNPDALFNQNVSLDDVRKAISQSNVRRPQGFIHNDENRWQIQTNDELAKLKIIAQLLCIIIKMLSCV